MTKSWRTILATGAIPLVTGILILGSTALGAAPDYAFSGRITSLVSGLGFAFAGLGLLALTRRKDRSRLLARTSALLLGGLAVAGFTLIGLSHQTVTGEQLPQTFFFTNDLDLLLSLGFFANAGALTALTLSGRKRAGASFAAALAISVAIIGASSLVLVLLGLQSSGFATQEIILASTILPLIGWGLFTAAKDELHVIAMARGGPLLDTSLSAATGTCVGLVALASLLLFSLMSREAEDAQHLREIDRLRSVLQNAHGTVTRVRELVTQSGETSSELDQGAFGRALKNAKIAVGELQSFIPSPDYQRPLNSVIAETSKALTRLQSAAQLQHEGRAAAAAQALAVYRISDASASENSALSQLEATLQAEVAERSIRHDERRRHTAIALSSVGVLMTVLLGAVHLLFQRDSASRQRSEATLRRHNETLKNFAHTVAHDLRAPLRGIAGYASELDGQSHLVDARGRHCISQINSAAQNLERLIGDTLNYAQLDAETPTMTTIVLPALVASLLQQRASEIRQHGTVVDTHFGIVTVTSWERGLVQIIGNLLDNAIKYSRHAHPPRLRIETAQTPLSWRIVIHDNGIGFDMKYHDRIFGLFQRLVTTHEFEGTGAGLAIVRKITDRLGGTVVAEGRPGGGATFLVELPRIVSSDLA